MLICYLIKLFRAPWSLFDLILAEATILEAEKLPFFLDERFFGGIFFPLPFYIVSQSIIGRTSILPDFLNIESTSMLTENVEYR